MEYPKIQTLFPRPEGPGKRHVDLKSGFRLDEFYIPRSWILTEKIHGTNVRILLHADGTIEFKGRTDRAMLYPPLLAWLENTVARERVAAAFDPETEACLYGEGYGPRIQSGGERYQSTLGLCLFDVVVFGTRRGWLDEDDVHRVARKLELPVVPFLWNLGAQEMTVENLYMLTHQLSAVAAQQGGDPTLIVEGIVARTDPLLFTQAGERLMWKLKAGDFPPPQ